MKHFLIDATPCAPERLTGAGRIVYQLISHLFDRDRENSYLLFGFAPQIWPPARLPTNFTYRQIRPWKPLGPLAMEAARRSFVGWRGARYRLDVLHCTLEMTPLYEERTKVLFSLYDLARLSPHFLYSTPQNLRSLVRTRLRYGLARKADLIHTISRYSADQIASRLRIKRDRIRVIYPGVDPLFSPGAPDPGVLERFGVRPQRYFLFVGQLGRQKNEEGLIRAFVQALQENALPADARLILAGDASALRDSTRNLLGGDTGRERITTPGAVSDPDLLHLYRGAIGVVLPSFHEGFGLPALEAMACGVAPIVSNASSLPEVVGEAGLVVPAGRTPELAEALAKLAGDGAWRAALCEKARERSRQFTFGAMADGLLALYREMSDG
jgi:glycosyltransferase involved in cell wall biosynthesis